MDKVSESLQKDKGQPAETPPAQSVERIVIESGDDDTSDDGPRVESEEPAD